MVVEHQPLLPNSLELPMLSPMTLIQVRRVFLLQLITEIRIIDKSLSETVVATLTDKGFMILNISALF